MIDVPQHAEGDYFVILYSGNNKYLIENVVYNEGKLEFAVSDYQTMIVENSTISIYEDTAANKLLKLRGYQTNGSSIRLYSTILRDKFEFKDNSTTTSKLYDKFVLTMNVKVGDEEVGSGSIAIGNVYEYLYSNENGVFAFDDTYVFSIGADLASFAIADTETTLKITLTEAVYYKDGTVDDDSVYSFEVILNSNGTIKEVKNLTTTDSGWVDPTPNAN